jgi:hypothetical protein
MLDLSTAREMCILRALYTCQPIKVNYRFILVIIGFLAFDLSTIIEVYTFALDREHSICADSHEGNRIGMTWVWPSAK